MAETKRRVPDQRIITVGNDYGDLAAWEAKQWGDGSAEATVRAGEELAEGAADPLREPHC